MKFRSLLAFFALLQTLIAGAQLPGHEQALEPVKWSISTTAVKDGTWEVSFRADIEHGWYVYSQQSFGEMGPIPTTIAFDTVAHAAAFGAEHEISTLAPAAFATFHGGGA